MINDYLKKNMFVGYDLVMHEQISNKLKVYGDILFNLEKIFVPLGVKLIPHVGESSIPPKIFNDNIFDSIILGCKRLGHGFNIAQDKVLLDYIKKKNITLYLEICPLSNVIFSYVKFLNNHPALYLLHNDNIRITLSSDNGGIFGYDDLSIDYCLAIKYWSLKYKDIMKIIKNGIECINDKSLVDYYMKLIK
jgi:adenosine deaminase CECR1